MCWSGSFQAARERRRQGVGHEGVAVDEQGDLAVGEDGGAGHGRQLGEVGGQRAGHELALADERRDRQRDAALLALHDDGELAVVGALVAERGGGVVERQDGVADDEHALAGGGAHGVVDEADGAVDAVQRDAEDAAAGAHEQRRHDGQRQRQADLGGRARAGLGGQQDLAAQLADLGAHRVHPDAAAGDVVGVVAGGEAGREEQLDGAGHVDRLGLLGGDEPGADGLGGDGVAIDAAAVVGHRDDDVAAGVAGGDAHGAGGGLPAASRSAGVSRPWSSALRTRCTSGSPSASTTVRSSSVSWPTSSSSTCLPSLVERSRTSRGKRRKTASTGIMRTCMTIACRACEQRVRSCMACERPGHLGLGGEDLDLGALDDELAHEVHELVQALGVDADGGGGATGLAALAGHDGRRAPGRPARRSPSIAGLGDLGDLGDGDVGHGGQGGAERGGLDPRGDPHVHAAAVEGLDVVLLRGGGDDGAQVGGGGDDHVGPHRGHQACRRPA